MSGLMEERGSLSGTHLGECDWRSISATPALRPPAQLVMGGPLPRQPAREPSNPELVAGTDPEMEHPPAVTPDATN